MKPTLLSLSVATALAVSALSTAPAFADGSGPTPQTGWAPKNILQMQAEMIGSAGANGQNQIVFNPVAVPAGTIMNAQVQHLSGSQTLVDLSATGTVDGQPGCLDCGSNRIVGKVQAMDQQAAIGAVTLATPQGGVPVAPIASGMGTSAYGDADAMMQLKLNTSPQPMPMPQH